MDVDGVWNDILETWYDMLNPPTPSADAPPTLRGLALPVFDSPSAIEQAIGELHLKAANAFLPPPNGWELCADAVTIELVPDRDFRSDAVTVRFTQNLRPIAPVSDISSEKSAPVSGVETNPPLSDADRSDHGGT